METESQTCVFEWAVSQYLEALFHAIQANITEREKARPHACQGLLQLKTHSRFNVMLPHPVVQQ